MDSHSFQLRVTAKASTKLLFSVMEFLTVLGRMIHVPYEKEIAEFPIRIVTYNPPVQVSANPRLSTES